MIRDRSLYASSGKSGEGGPGLPYRACVGIMLVNGAGDVFVGQRNDTGAPAWQMPQGGIDAGETPRTAALRELREETGVTPDLLDIRTETDTWLRYDLPPELVGTAWGGRYRGQEQKWFLMRFLGRDADVCINSPHAEFAQWRWLAPQALVASIVAFKREVYAEVLRRFAGRLRDADDPDAGGGP